MMGITSERQKKMIKKIEKHEGKHFPSKERVEIQVQFLDMMDSMREDGIKFPIEQEIEDKLVHCKICHQ